MQVYFFDCHSSMLSSSALNREVLAWDKLVWKYHDFCVTLCTVYPLQLVRCLSCHRTFVAGGLNKTSSTTATEVNSQQTHEFTKPAVKLVSSPLAISSTCTPRRYGSTPSNKLKHRRRRSSTLKAQLARSSAVQQQQGQLGVGASPKLNMFLTSVQWCHCHFKCVGSFTKCIFKQLLLSMCCGVGRTNTDPVYDVEITTIHKVPKMMTS